MKRLAALAFAFAAVPAATADEVAATVALRDTGYVLGDLIDEHIDVALPAGGEIDPDSLPAPGRVTPWMELRRARIESPRGGSQALVVTYQIFGMVEQPTRVSLPPLKLRTRGDARTIDVPPQPFLLSPALPSTLADEDRELRPSTPPSQLPAARWLAAALACLALAIVAGAYLLWRYDRLPFLPRAPGPLLRAWRRWRHAREVSAREETRLLRDLHAALNLSAGETLYPSTLARLFERAPHLEPMRERIESTFAASWACFYGAPDATAPEARRVLDLLRDAADLERGVPC